MWFHRRRLVRVIVTSVCVLYLLTFVTLSLKEMVRIEGSGYNQEDRQPDGRDTSLDVHYEAMATNDTTRRSTVSPSEHLKHTQRLFSDMSSTIQFPILADIPGYASTVRHNWPHLCALSEDTPQGTYMVILVHSHVLNAARRDAIRDTWGRISRDYDNPRHIQIIFLLGLPEDPQDIDFIEKEAKLYRDILQWRFLDSYKNLSLKSILGFQWVLQHCSSAKFVMKADDDVYLNVSRILGQLTNYTAGSSYNSSDFLHGHINKKSPVLRVGQWGVPEQNYPFKTYPAYCSGAAYIMAVPTAKRLCDIIHTHAQLTVLPVEDVFITGIMASLAGFQCRHDNHIPGWMTLVSIDSVQDLLRGDLFGLHGVTDKKMRLLGKMTRECRTCSDRQDLIESMLMDDSDYLMYYDNMDEGFTDL